MLSIVYLLTSKWHNGVDYDLMFLVGAVDVVLAIVILVGVLGLSGVISWYQYPIEPNV